MFSFKVVMMNLTAVERSYFDLVLQVPDPERVEQLYRQDGGEMPFPFWSRVWPSALALSQWLKEEPSLVNEKSVLELGAGIGLPSLVAASQASRVVISDHIGDALPWIERNISALGLTNVECRQLSWYDHDLPAADVWLMSDIAYDPGDFKRIRELVAQQLNSHSLVLMSIPERSVSSVFISMMQGFPQKSRSVLAEGTQVILFEFGVPQQRTFGLAH